MMQKPISSEERLQRIAKVQRLMCAEGLDAIILEPGASLTYFTGIDWYRSERLTAAIIPAVGALTVVVPAFEADSVLETLSLLAEIRVWEEHENPIGILVDALPMSFGPVTLGIEDTVRFFVADGIRRAAPRVRIGSAAPVVRECRMLKSAAEIALMQEAADITVAAYSQSWPKITRGMTANDIASLMNQAMTDLGGKPEFALILLGEASAYPHGSNRTQEVRDGEIVLMDCGCSVHGYRSDISRTFVFGEADRRQRRIWDQVRTGQQIALEAARPGVPVCSVDAAVRREYFAMGYPDEYRTPGLPHRTGHGIGLDGHEDPYLVRGDHTPLLPGMCFSNEPGLYFPGEFGVRIEDCFYMTEKGPRWFSEPPRSIDDRLG